MTEHEPTPEVAVRPFAPRTYMATMPTWKKAMVAGATLMLVVAVVSIFVEEPARVVTDAGNGALTSTLDAQHGAGGPGNTTEVPTPWSQAFFKFGFSFFIGFAVGYAARAFLKLVMFLVGGLAICLFLLSYFGFVAVEWQSLDDAFREFGQLFTGQFDKFRTFITGSLPNAGLTGLGLFAGFKKNA